MGEGPSGAVSPRTPSGHVYSGNHGSIAGQNGVPSAPNSPAGYTTAKAYGGGGSGTYADASEGGEGCVRIMWPGDERQFPTTRTGYEQD